MDSALKGVIKSLMSFPRKRSFIAAALLVGANACAPYFGCGAPMSPTPAPNALSQAASQYAPTALSSGSVLAQSLNAAYRSEQAGSVDVALGYFQKAAEIDPASAEAFAGNGRCKCRRSDVDAAIGALRKACELAPNRPGWQLELGEALYRQGDRDAALTALQKAIRLDPKLGRAYEAIAKVQWAQKQYEAAKGSLEQAQALGCTLDPAFVERLNADLAGSHAATTQSH